MKLEIPVKPLSVNRAYKGRRFRTDDYDQFESDVCKLLPIGKYDLACKDEIYVFYAFYVSNYGNSDAANMEKTMTDVLVKREYLKDDRYIKSLTSTKVRTKAGCEGIEAYICTSAAEYLDIIGSYVK